MCAGTGLFLCKLVAHNDVGVCSTRFGALVLPKTNSSSGCGCDALPGGHSLCSAFLSSAHGAGPEFSFI